MNSRKKLLFFFFLFFPIFCSCSGSKALKEKIVIAIQASPISLDPRVATDAEGVKISRLVCDSLLKLDDELEFSPGIAKGYERVSDTSLRFFLRDNVLFSDDSRLTSDDVVYTFKSIKDGKIASPFKNRIEIISDVVAETPDIVRFDLKNVYAPILHSLNIGIVSANAAKRAKTEFGRVPVCAGPYVVKRFVSDSVVELSPNPNYFGERPKNAGIEFQVVKDDNIRVLKLIKGDVDLIQNAIPPMLIESVLKDNNLEMMQDTGAVVTYMGLNLLKPALSKQKVRQAIAYAINRDEIISHRWKGLAAKANSVIAPTNWAYDDDLVPYQYDPSKAKEFLDEAGYKDPDGDGPKKRFNLVYKTSNIKERIDIARMIADQLDKVGIGVRVEPYEWGTFFRDVKTGNFEIFTLSWVIISDPDFFYDLGHSSQVPPNGLNRWRYSNPTVDGLVEKGRHEMDEGKRKVIYDEVQRILLDELPYIPLWYEKNVVIYKKTLKNVRVRPDASYLTLVDVERM